MNMNIVEAVGGKKKERELAIEVVNWCIKKMMPRIKTLEISISFENIDAYGYCMEEDTNREFTVTIRKGLSIQELIGTVVHEMIHVKQYARKELRNVNGRTMWKTKDYSNVAYMDAPWEKEAYKLEKPYTLECFMSLNYTP
jgi:hypothetical protein